MHADNGNSLEQKQSVATNHLHENRRNDIALSKYQSKKSINNFLKSVLFFSEKNYLLAIVTINYIELNCSFVRYYQN